MSRRPPGSSYQELDDVLDGPVYIYSQPITLNP